MLLRCHDIGRTYGVLPSVVRRLDLDDLSFCDACRAAGAERDAGDLEQLKRGSVQPVYIVGGR